MTHHENLQTIMLQKYIVPIYFINSTHPIDKINKCGVLFFRACMYFDVLKAINKYDNFLKELVKLYNSDALKKTTPLHLFNDILENELDDIITFMSECIKYQFNYFNNLYNNFLNNSHKMMIDVINSIHIDKQELYKCKIINKKNNINDIINTESFNINFSCIYPDKFTYSYFSVFENIMINITEYNLYIKQLHSLIIN
jgi:hypothetical protein